MLTIKTILFDNPVEALIEITESQITMEFTIAANHCRSDTLYVFLIYPSDLEFTRNTPEGSDTACIPRLCEHILNMIGFICRRCTGPVDYAIWFVRTKKVKDYFDLVTYVTCENLIRTKFIDPTVSFERIGVIEKEVFTVNLCNQLVEVVVEVEEDQKATMSFTMGCPYVFCLTWHDIYLLKQKTKNNTGSTFQIILKCCKDILGFVSSLCKILGSPVDYAIWFMSVEKKEVNQMESIDYGYLVSLVACENIVNTGFVNPEVNWDEIYQRLRVKMGSEQWCSE